MYAFDFTQWPVIKLFWTFSVQPLPWLKNNFDSPAVKGDECHFRGGLKTGAKKKIFTTKNATTSPNQNRWQLVAPIDNLCGEVTIHSNVASSSDIKKHDLLTTRYGTNPKLLKIRIVTTKLKKTKNNSGNKAQTHQAFIFPHILGGNKLQSNSNKLQSNRNPVAVTVTVTLKKKHSSNDSTWRRFFVITWLLEPNSSDDATCFEFSGDAWIRLVRWLVTKTNHKFHASDFVSIYQQVGIRIPHDF